MTDLSDDDVAFINESLASAPTDRQAVESLGARVLMLFQGLLSLVATAAPIGVTVFAVQSTTELRVHWWDNSEPMRLQDVERIIIPDEVDDIPQQATAARGTQIGRPSIPPPNAELRLDAELAADAQALALGTSELSVQTTGASAEPVSESAVRPQAPSNVTAVPLAPTIQVQ